MRKIAAVQFDPNSNMWHYQNLFLLSFCFIGINFADLLTLKPENLIDGRIVFHRKKTGKIYSIKIPDEAMKRLHPYNINKVEGKNDFLLPFVKNTGNPAKLKKDIALVIHAVNENLKTISSKQKITKPVSTYYARYSWANIAKLLGYSKDLIAEALGHEYGNKVTGIYLDDYDKEVIDEMNEKVIKSVFNT
jgi:integrase